MLMEPEVSRLCIGLACARAPCRTTVVVPYARTRVQRTAAVLPRPMTPVLLSYAC